MSSENTLRTLKDLFINEDGTEWGESTEWGVGEIMICNVRDELKAEAIKWVKKSLKEKKKMNEKEMAYWVEVGKISIMEEFFNLTEEDLK